MSSLTQKISKRQQAILAFIKEEVRSKGYPPSVREIGEADKAKWERMKDTYYRKKKEFEER